MKLSENQRWWVVTLTLAVLAVASSVDAFLAAADHQASNRTDANRPVVHQAIGGIYDYVQDQRRRAGQPPLPALPDDWKPVATNR